MYDSIFSNGIEHHHFHLIVLRLRQIFDMNLKWNKYFITFDLVLHVIEQSLLSTKHSSPPITTSNSSLSSFLTSSIVI